MDRRKLSALICIIVGIAVMAVPLLWEMSNARRTEAIINAFEQTIIHDTEAALEISDIDSDEEIKMGEGVIGIIEIESIGIRYPIIEGTPDEALNSGIGHLSETAAIGEKGNAVLCGHNGSRKGEFFTHLSQTNIGDEVTIMDLSGNTHRYRIADSYIVDAYDTDIKAQSDNEELTLFTCADRGTMRYVVKCLPIMEWE
jgi:sortase A